MKKSMKNFTSRVESSPLAMRAYTAAATLILVWLFWGADAAAAQEPGCGVGTKIQIEGGSDTVGTIEEIGTTAPHVGWFRITFSWSPKGEWYPATYDRLLIAGTKTSCSQASRRGTRQAPKSDRPQRPVTGTAAATAGADGCPFNEPPGRVTRISPASAQLFRRVIFERAAAKINPDSISAPKKVGVTFLEFNMGAAYKNTLTSSRFGDKRRHDGAPAGAIIYPIATKEMVCELHGAEVRRTVTEASRSCFKNRDGDWVCPPGPTKVLESRLIPIR